MRYKLPKPKCMSKEYSNNKKLSEIFTSALSQEKRCQERPPSSKPMKLKTVKEKKSLLQIEQHVLKCTITLCLTHLCTVQWFQGHFLQWIDPWFAPLLAPDKRFKLSNTETRESHTLTAANAKFAVNVPPQISASRFDSWIFYQLSSNYMMDIWLFLDQQVKRKTNLALHSRKTTSV